MDNGQLVLFSGRQPQNLIASLNDKFAISNLFPLK